MTSTLRTTVLALGLSFGLLAACSSSKDDGGGGGGSGGSDEGGSGGSSSGGKGGNSGGASGGVTFTEDVLPIFKEKCTPCHAKGGSAASIHSMATDYTSVQRSSNYCEGKKKGECTIVRIQKGEMPQGAGCTGNPDTDKDNAKCLTKAEQDTVQAWIDGGLLEK
jgi:hypothetical protein